MPWRGIDMLDMAKYVAVICAPTMAIVARLIDSADDRRDRARLDEFIRLQQQAQGRS